METFPHCGDGAELRVDDSHRGTGLLESVPLPLLPPMLLLLLVQTPVFWFLCNPLKHQ